MLKRCIVNRVDAEANYIIRTGATMRACAKIFGVSKSCVHRDMTVVLKELDLVRYNKTRAVAAWNLSQRHHRGGEVTKRRYLEQTIKNNL